MTDAKKPWEQQFDGGASGAGAEPWKQDYGANGPRGLKGWSPEKEPGFADRFKQGVSRAVDSAQVALSGDAGVIAKVAADQQRDALPQTELQRQMAEEIEPYNEAAKNAKGVGENVRAWGALGFKRAGQLISNPAEAGKMIVEQLPNSIPGLAGGFAGAKAGAAVGTAVAPGLGTAVGAALGGLAGGFAGGYGLEKGASVLEQVQEKAQEQGIDLQDQAAARGFVAKNLREIDETATRKAVGTAGTDAALNVLTLGAAGLSGRGIVNEARALTKAVNEGTVSAADASAALARLEAANAARNTTGRKVARGGAVVGAEMAGEGLSEAVGQKYAYGEVDPGEVIDEALLGLGQGGAMALGGKAFRKAAGLPDGDDAATSSLDGAHAALAKAKSEQPGAEGMGTGAGEATAMETPLAPAGGMEQPSVVTEPTPRPSEAMGLRSGPEAGALENAAAMSVDTGATAQLQEAAALAEQPEQPQRTDIPTIDYSGLDDYDRAAYDSYFDSVDEQTDNHIADSLNDNDIPWFDTDSNVSDEDFLRQLGASEQEIFDALQTANGARGPQESAAGNAQAQANEAAGARANAQPAALTQDQDQQVGDTEYADLQAELRDEQAADNMPDVPDSAFARTQEDAGPVPKNVEIQGAQQQAAPGSQAEGANVATLAQLNRKKLAEMSDDELQQLSALLPADHSRQQKIQKAIQARAAQAQPAINEGAQTDGTQTPKAQQSGAQPAQAGAAQASKPAGQGLNDGATPAENDGRQASAPTAPQAQTQELDRQQRAKRIEDAGAQWTRMPAAERSALVGRLEGVKPVIAKNMPRAAWGDLNGDIQKKLADAMAPRVGKPSNGVDERANTAAEQATDALNQQMKAGTFSGPAGLMGMRVRAEARIKSLEQDLADAPDAERAAIAKKLESEQRGLADIDKEIVSFNEKMSAAKTQAQAKKPAAKSKPVQPLMQAAKDSGKLEVVHVGDKPAKAEAQSAPEADKDGNTIVGRRKDGVMIRQDKRGVRWYAEGGVRIQETVSMRPTAQGMQMARGELKPDFMTAEESAEAGKDEQVSVEGSPDGWRNTLMKTRAHAKSLIDAGKLDAQAAQAAWSDHDKLLALLDAQEKADAATQPEDAKGSSTKSDNYGSKNKLVSQSRADELRAKLREKAKNNMFGGLDTEMMAWGTELAVFHLEAGVRKFSDLVAAMARDLETTPVKLKPYLRSWYNGARDMMEDHGLSIEGMDSPETVRAELAKIGTEAAPDSEAKTSAPSLSESLLSAIRAGNMPKDNPALKKLVEAFDGKPADPARMKEAQEQLEAAIVAASREVVAKSEGDKATFDALLRLYESQPNLNVRTSTSIANQAYSTPAPLAFIASQLAGITKQTLTHEPTAGTGMLLIGADPKNSVVNELNDLRVSLLEQQGFTPTQKDAATAPLRDKRGPVDAVITNPPFGSVKDDSGKATKVKVDGYNLGQIDHLIAARALETMKDDGRAVLILGANKAPGGLSTDDRIFFNWLYSHYNVVGHFEVAGDLYARQGAGWPVRVITIAGREKSARISPVAGTIERVDNWSQVYDQYKQLLDSSGRPVRSAGAAAGRPVAGQAQPADVPSAAGPEAAKSDRPGRTERAGGNGNVTGARAGAVADLTGATTDPVGHEPDEQRLNAQSFVPPRLDATGQGAKPVPAKRPAKPAGTAAVADAPAEAGNEFQTKYIPRSARKDEGVLIPSNMAQPTQDALNHLEDQVGDIDDFARKELGYDSTKALHNALMGLQVDSVATAIHQIKQGKAVVIADQTGIGKGRQAASIIRWAARNGMTPVFVSVKPSLFTDMYGDLADIGTHDVDPFIMNADAWVSGQDGEKLFANKAGTHRAAIEAIANNGALPAGRNALFMTYSQINTDNAQRRALRALAGNAVFVLDESHNAAGASGTGEFMISVLKEAKGVTYLSATYAKRPDNMPLYFKTDIGDAAADSEGLANAMSAGGLPLQTVVSNNLVKAGQMFRRERSYDGVSIASTFDRKNRALHEEMSDTATQALRAIVRADRLFHEIYVKQLQKQLKKEGGDLKDIAGNQASAGVQHTEFSSVVHNFVRQMLLGLKAQTAADEAIASLKRGEKPIIAVENTMGSFLSEYASSNGLSQGDSLGSFDYRTVLSRALERSRALVETLPTGEEVRKTISLAQLDPITRKAYDQAQEVIDGLKIAIPVSPIDWMRAEIERAGFSVAEITGRNLAVDYSNKGEPVLSAIEQSEQRDKVATTRRFNGGELDALILNVAGSTGISLHASEKFQDQRQRHMIVAQAAGDINIFMQMLGRIHRTGQVRLPKYTILSVDLPTEKRPTAVLSKKMKSLNANTSSNTESATSVKTADILNKYGDQIVHQYLQDNMELARQLDVDDIVGGDTPAEDIARKATGRLALQPIEVQNSFYEDVEAQYDALIEYLNKTNQNDLEPRTFDFDAKETRSEVLFDGPNKETPFGADAIYGEYSIKAQGSPMTPDEIKAAIESNLGGKTGAEHAEALADQMLQTYAKQFNQAREKAGTTPDTFAMDKYTALMKSAFGDVGVNMAEEAQALIAKGMPLPAMTPRDMMRAQGVGTGMDFIKSHAIGRTFRVDINSEPFNAVVTNVRNTHKATGNPFSMSKLQLTVSVNGALRSITVPATQFKKIEISSIAPTFRVEQLFKEQPPNQRETAKIITGNLLAAYGELKGVNGTIISFTTADGGTEQGILLPKLFDYAKNTQGDYRLRSGAEALNFLQRSENKDIGRFGIATRDGLVRVLPYGDGVQVRVPRSKAQGARYFLDKNLIAIAGDFVSTANAMAAKVENADDAVKLLDLLMDKQALYALPSMAEEAKALAPKDAPAEDSANYVGAAQRRPASAQDKAVMQAIAEGKSARDVLRVVASGSKDPFLRQVARLLLKSGITPNIEFGHIGKSKGNPIHGQYRGKTDTIAIAGSAEYAAERIFMHEAMHAATMRALAKPGLVRLQLQKLAAHVRKQPGAAGFYGISDKNGNVDEFVAEVFTNPDFQAALRKMSAPSESSAIKTAWDGFVRILRSILGLKNDPNNALSQALQLGVAAMREDMGLRQQGVRAEGAANYGADNFAALKASALEQLHQTLSHPGKVSIWDKTVGTMRNLAERVPQFKPVFEAAQRFIDDVSMLANDAADFAPRLMPRVESWADLKKKPITAADNKAVAKPLFEGTLMWARDLDGTPVTTEALNAKYRNTSADEKAQIMLRTGKLDDRVLKMWKGMPVESFEKAVASKFDSTILKPGIVWTQKELQTIFKLDDKQVGLYQEARAAIDRSLDMTARTDMLRAMGEQFAGMREAVLGQENLQDAFTLVVDTLQEEARANPDMADRLMDINNSVVKRYETATELMDKGYAPLSRFGKYTVDVVDQDGERQYFGMFESMREANQMAMKMRDVFKDAAVTQGTMSEQAFKLFQGITPESLEQFGSMLGLNGDGNEAQDKAFQAYLQLAKNNHSALKRLIHRKGIDGYSEDVGRVLASFVYSNARLGSQGLNAGTMENAIEGIPKEMGELRDVAMGLRNYIKDPQEEGQAVRGMLFAQYLGGSLASAFVNMTQPFQITMPWLSQYGGMAQAGKQMARALNDMRKSWMDKSFSYEPELAKALKEAEDDGTVSPQEIHQLMAQARGTGSLRTGDGTKLGDARAAAANNWERVKVAWGQPFALAEQFNRRSTFIASYRIAKAQGIADPAEFARKAVLETQFLYSKANKMRWGRGAIGGTLMTFKTYSVSYLELMHRMWTQGGPEGKRAVGWAVAMLLLMGGAGGLPFMEDAEDLIDGAAQLMGYNLSTKQARKEFLSSVVGKELSEFMEQGVSGLPGAPIDVSGRLGMGNLIPGTGLFMSKQNRERDLMEIAGPAGDLVARGFTGARKALTGDFSGAALEAAPTAVRNAFKGIDMATSGIYKDTKGYKVMDVTLAEAASKFLGFQPKSVAEDGEASSFKQRTKSFYIQTSADIKAQWAAAVFNKDDAALERVRDRLAAWNRNNPDLPITVKIPDIMKKVREMGKDREQRINDTAPKALRQQFREMAQDANR